MNSEDVMKFEVATNSEDVMKLEVVVKLEYLMKLEVSMRLEDSLKLSVMMLEKVTNSVKTFCLLYSVLRRKGSF